MDSTADAVRDLKFELLQKQLGFGGPQTTTNPITPQMPITSGFLPTASFTQPAPTMLLQPSAPFSTPFAPPIPSDQAPAPLQVRTTPSPTKVVTDCGKWVRNPYVVAVAAALVAIIILWVLAPPFVKSTPKSPMELRKTQPWKVLLGGAIVLLLALLGPQITMRLSGACAKTKSGGNN